MEVFIRIFFGTSFLLVWVFEMIITGEGKMDIYGIIDNDLQSEIARAFGHATVQAQMGVRPHCLLGFLMIT